MANYTIAFQKADDEAFTVNVTSRTFIVLGAKPFSVPRQGTIEAFAAKGINSTARTRHIAVQFENFGVVDDASYGQDFGDLEELETYLFAPFLRIIATGTSLPRTNGTANYWTTRLGAAPIPVTREQYSPATAFDQKADTASAILREVDPVP